ncbi:MFS transporter [Adlercreutzia sp. ZJ304]|uniref:MFS transporter n=1 Tax=Adlercreutzia sp. ZJ304 TaxID=2709791 RepID=UPI0013EB844E|nr:MFS transporter [Adlercreutzia sp. ZJ304]
MPEDIKRKVSYYAIAVAFAGMLTQFTLIFCQSSFSQVIPDFLESTGLTKTDSGVITSTFGIVYALSGIVWGWVNDRIGSRSTYAIMGLGGSLFMILFALLSTNLLVATLLYSIMGFMIGGMAAASLPKLIGNWFTPSRRGFGMTIANVGGVLCGALIGVLVPQILIATNSWRTTLTTVGIIAAVIAVVYILIMRNKPSDKGLLPFGPEEEVRAQVEDQKKIEKEKKPGIRAYLDALKLKNIWILGIMYIFFQFAYSGTNSYLATSFRELGQDAVMAGFAVTIYNIAQFIGQLFWGNLSDRIPRKWAMAGACFTWGVFGAVFCFTYGADIIIMYVIVFFMGIGLGAMSVKNAINIDYIPGEIRGTGAGVVATYAVIGRYLGPMLTAVLWESVGLQWAFLAMGGAMILAGLTALLLPKITKKEAI